MWRTMISSKPSAPVVPEPRDNGLRAPHQQLGFARPAIALGQYPVHLDMHGGLGLRYEDIPA